MRFLRSFLFVVFLGAIVENAAAQEGLPASGVLVVDQELLFTNTEFGIRLRSDIAEVTDKLVAENRTIESSLVEEEQRLTDQRAELSPEKFRELADAFDLRVQTIRSEQDQKREDIGQLLEQNRRTFFQAIIPILAEIMRQERASVILNKRTVLLSVNLIDITDRAIEMINAEIGDGSGLSTANDN